MRIDVSRFPAFALDLDGVITKTATVHAAAWKQLLDELLAARSGARAWRPFDPVGDYRTFVDGKPRRDGLRSFLAARGLSIPEGTPDDGPEIETIAGLAARKDRYLRERLARDGVAVHPDAEALLRRARAAGVRLAVVTASESCAGVLEAARLTEIFEVRVDGIEVRRLGLRGKPAPDTFLEAARRLGVSPSAVAMFEDALAGVRAGRAGALGLVVGVDRAGLGAALRDAGADHVIATLDDVELVGELVR